MATIKKSDKAPKGTISVSVGVNDFKVTDDKTYETDIPELLSYAEADENLEVDYTGDPDEAAVAKAESKDLTKLQKARARADKQRAEKDPLDDPAPKPSSVDELEEVQADNDGGKD